MTGGPLSVIIVNYNAGRLLRDCLASLWPQLDRGSEVFLVDNASNDGSTTGLEEKFSGITLISNSQNVGFSRATNQALRLSRGAYILLLNPDVVLEPGALQVALKHMEDDPQTSVLGAKMMLPTGQPDPAAHRSFKTASTYFYKVLGLSRLFPSHPRFGRYYLSYVGPQSFMDVDAVVGAFLLIRRSVVNTIGFLDERFYMYCEDEDWCWRVKQAGGRVVYHPGVVTHHWKGTSSRQMPMRMIYHWHRSLFLYHRKNIAPHYSFLSNSVVYCGIFMIMVFRLLFQALRQRLTFGTRSNGEVRQWQGH